LAGRSIDLLEHLTEAQLDGCACIRCGDEHSDKCSVEAWREREQSMQLFEYDGGDDRA
jgi:Zn ribbon nucleic-acid-binding protein